MAVFGIEWFKSEYGATGGRMHPYQEGASQTYKKGQLCVLSGGQAVLATTTGPAGLVALEDASGNQGTSQQFYVIREGDLWSASVSTDGATLDTTLTHLGTKCGWIASTQASSTDKFTVNIADTTNTVLEVYEFHSGDHPDASTSFVGVTDGRVIFRVTSRGLTQT